MDLTKLRPIDFRERLDALETQAITLSKRRNDVIIRAAAGSAAGIGTMLGGIMLIVALMASFVHWPLWLFMTTIVLGSTAVTGAMIAAAGRYLAPPERKLLAAIAEPDANDFLDDNWQRRDRLLAEAEAFNDALKAFRALPERAGGDEIDEGVVANLAERRERFEAEAEKYLAEFRAATAEERGRVAEANRPRIKRVDGFRKSLRDFKRKVRQLAALDRSLEGLLDSVGGGTTVDIAPYQAALRFREELEEERATLIRCGLKPRKLPAPRTSRKFLPKPR